MQFIAYICFALFDVLKITSPRALHLIYENKMPVYFYQIKQNIIPGEVYRWLQWKNNFN